MGRKSGVQIEDPWVERLARAASADIKYNVMVQHLETKSKFGNIPKECELSGIQEGVEIKHTKLFNTHPGHTLHVDYFELKSKRN